ncbi:MAG: hypothetical protein LBD58_00225 [Treponema sp.]|nr:hypothetical protein [Treponema sp.]
MHKKQAYIIGKCVNILDNGAYINASRSNIARKGADMANRMDRIPDQVKLAGFTTVWYWQNKRPSVAGGFITDFCRSA